MIRDKFPEEVSVRLNWYVYRLVDPRDGQTFYVGKGKGDRIFQHARAALSKNSEEDVVSLKYQRIKAIEAARLEVGMIIHRHGIADEKIAFEVEAALIDAYPGLTNLVAGHGSDEFGVRHVEQVIRDYEASELDTEEAYILISIGKSMDDENRNIYESVRGVWKIDVKRAQKYKLILAHRRGIIVGAFRPSKWVKATKENFEWLSEDIDGRWGFEGVPVDAIIEKLYLGKRVPAKLRKRGAANPVRFV